MDPDTVAESDVWCQIPLGMSNMPSLIRKMWVGIPAGLERLGEHLPCDVVRKYRVLGNVPALLPTQCAQSVEDIVGPDHRIVGGANHGMVEPVLWFTDTLLPTGLAHLPGPSWVNFRQGHARPAG